ncbi:Small GTPase LIP1 [Vitis vinifera]|uniref:Small GTPase LIP1 n=1 Tax=Vitis vinifera TaxID=29760 RepID=A0A438IDS7_VITVI|nr:Small GTPase LIP1 [Vitis vinifera]
MTYLEKLQCWTWESGLNNRNFTADAVGWRQSWQFSLKWNSFSAGPRITHGQSLEFAGRSLSGDPYKYNILPPLPARNYMPPSAQRPQQPVSISDNYNLPRFTRTESPNSSNSRSKRADINI